MGLMVRQSKEVKSTKNHIYQYCKALLVTMNYLWVCFVLGYFDMFMSSTQPRLKM